MSENEREFTQAESQAMHDELLILRNDFMDIRTRIDIAANQLAGIEVRMNSIIHMRELRDIDAQIEADDTQKDNGDEVCQRCNGGGVEHCHRCSGMKLLLAGDGKLVDCPNCAGLGTHKCTRCHGLGWEQ